MHEITKLILKHSRGQLSVTEAEQLNAWRKESLENEALFCELTNQQTVAENISVQEESKMRVWRRLGKVGEIESASRLQTIQVRVRWAAAAMILLAVSVLLLSRNTRKIRQTQDPIVYQSKPDLTTPTGANAILTLSNGQKIYLDSAKAGNLSRQGNAQIIKVSNRELAYQQVDPKLNPISADPQYNTLSTMIGGQTVIRLSDGSHAYLNAGSSIRYPTTFGNMERRVEITGEAYFEVAPMTKPFFVVANNVQIRVLGTHFNVMAYGNEETLETTLLTGSVLVTGISKTMILRPGEQFRANTKTYIVELVKNVDTNVVTAWRNGQFEFSVARIDAVMRQLERWYPVQVSYDRGIVPNLRLSGTISRQMRLSDILRLLENNGAHFKKIGDHILVLN